MRNKFTKLKTYLTRLVRGNERGVALIFTLGILGLLMVIALAFASTSMVERKVAANVNNNQVAKLLAKSALERIEAGLNAHGTVDPSYLLSHDKNVSPQSYDWLWKMETSDSDVTYTLPSGAPADSAYPTWQYVLAYKNSTDSEIIGRFAYAVVPNNGKLDPTAVADSSTASIPRPGVSVTEIDIANIHSDFANKDDVWGDTLLKTLGSNGRWSDLSQLAKAVSADISKLSTYFQVRTTPDPESFWFDLNGDDKVDTGEAYHRFNMVRTDWWNDTTKVGVEIETICPSAATDTTIAKQYTKTLADSNDTGGIPWFKNWSSSDNKDSFTNIADKRNQIVANFIQYNCAESRPVISDVTASTWNTITSETPLSEPAYTGNKRTPYLNEIEVDVDVSAIVEPTGTGPYDLKITFSISVKIMPELINMYGSSVLKGPLAGDEWPVYLFGQLEVTPYVNGVAKDVQTVLLSNTATTRYLACLPGANGYSTAPAVFSNGDANPIIHDYVVNLTGQASTTAACTAKGTLKLYRAVLGSVDYAKLNTTDYITSSNTVVATPISKKIAYQVTDPRQNLNSGDWTPQNPSPGAVTLVTTCLPNTSGGDSETTSNPAYVNTGASQHVSTAYIRHAPMKSPWELGAIHRGAAWQTLNLNKNASRSAANALIGGGAYADGDANLLDQVKFTADTEVYGKVNLNTSIDEVLNALFAKLPYRDGDVSASESKYENPGTGSSYSQVSAGSSFKTMRGATVYKRRTEFISGPSTAFMTALYSGLTSPATDAQKEQLVSKFINLTKAEPLLNDELAVVILTQSIKEAQPGVVVVKDWNNNGNLASTARSTDTNTGKFNSGYRSYNGTDFTPLALTCDIKEYYTPDKKIKLCRYENGADQITGECKMIVVYARDTATGKWKMKRVRYVE